jgi:hypothetical protein
MLARNPHYASASEMRLYLLEERVETAERTPAFQERRAKLAEQAARRKASAAVNGGENLSVDVAALSHHRARPPSAGLCVSHTTPHQCRTIASSIIADHLLYYGQFDELKCWVGRSQTGTRLPRRIPYPRTNRTGVRDVRRRVPNKGALQPHTSFTCPLRSRNRHRDQNNFPVLPFAE